jgi:hypothetical protein
MRSPRFLAGGLAALMVICAGGCRALVELIEAEEDGPAGDGGVGPDASVDCTWPFQPERFDPCAIPSPGEPLILGPGEWWYDTNSGALTDPALDAWFPASALIVQPGGVEIRVVSADAVDLQEGAILRATGKRPLVLVSWSDLTVAGVVDVGSRPGSAGAGADPETCPDADRQDGENSGDGAGGGGGGGFGSPGARGGDGNAGDADGGDGGDPLSLPGALRGGCPGGDGGNQSAGDGGPSGGAVHLVARDTLTIAGIVTAGGSGGGGSTGNRGGGGGGGSGGMIELEAGTVRLARTGVLASNGGGGGGGGDGGVALPGEDGRAAAAPARGGLRQGMGADGGDGAFADVAAERGEMANRGGGGGGGGTGFIVIRSATIDDAGAVLSPAPVGP